MLKRIEHVCVQVGDPDEAVEWYTETMGLVEIEREDGRVYLGTGLDDRFDLAVEEGSPALDHFAVKADETETIDQTVDCLEEAGISHERVGGVDPGQTAGVRFPLPTGPQMEVVTVEEFETGQGYAHSDEGMVGCRGGITPSDFDHITFLSADLRADVNFLRDIAGLSVSEIAGADDDLEMAFVRCNNRHHDIALRQNPNPSVAETGLHHLAWEFDGIEHMKLFLDHICRNGIDIERGLGRHYAGDNLYAYFWEPGGHRFEICAEMARIKSDTVSRAETYEDATVAWGPPAPETFSRTTDVLSK